MSESVEQVGAPPVLEVEDSHKTYPGGTYAAKGVPFTISKGECLGVVGESGPDKSTFAKCLLTPGLVSAGRATLEGEPPPQRRGKGLRDICRRLQVVSQDPTSSFNSRLMMYDPLLESLRTRGFVSSSFVQPGTQRKIAEQLADLMRLSVSCPNRKPHELSGGEKQWMAIARVISVEPTPLVFDELTASLDVSTQARVLNLLQELKEELGLPLMFISHDLSAVQFMSKRSIVLHSGEIVDRFGRSELFEDGCDQYTKDFIRFFEG